MIWAIGIYFVSYIISYLLFKKTAIMENESDKEKILYTKGNRCAALAISILGPFSVIAGFVIFVAMYISKADWSHKPAKW